MYEEVALWRTHYCPDGRSCFLLPKENGRLSELQADARSIRHLFRLLAVTTSPASLGRLNRSGSRVPSYRALPKIRFVGHVACKSRVVSKYRVLGHLLVVPHALEIAPQVRLFVIPGIAAICIAFQDRLFPGNRIVLRMPLRHIGISHFLRDRKST